MYNLAFALLLSRFCTFSCFSYLCCMEIKVSVKKCFVPSCGNTDNIAPTKIYIPVPRKLEIRKLWCNAVGRNVSKAALYCCEDHFQLKDDAENFVQFRLTGCRLILKENVVPRVHIELPSSDTDISQISPSSRKRQKDFVSQRGGLENVTVVKKLKFEAFVKPKSPTKLDVTSSPSKSYTSTSTSTISSSPSDFIVTESASTDSSEDNIDEELKQLSKQRITLVMEKASRFYLGLPKDVYFIVKMIPTLRPIKYVDILVTLKKIRLNDPYFRIAIDFGISTSYVGSIIRKSIKVLAEVFHQLIIWPSSKENFKHLPIAFRKRYYRVNSIIDCFEITIEKPSNPEHQALTWSTYKNANTIKYLISCTPYGLINYISRGFGGRASDIIIVEESEYLNKLPQNVDVMADRGFKHLSGKLKQKNCNLVRPPSVSEGEVLSREQVLESKRIASLRIHVERVISRIREFQFLNPHACIDIHSLGMLDAAVIIAAGIINLQPALVKY